MAQPLTSFDNFFDQMSAPQGTGVNYDLGGDTAETPTGGTQTGQAAPAPSSGQAAPAPAQPAAPSAPAPQQAAPAAPQQSAGYAAPSTAAPRTSTHIDVAGFAAPKAATGFAGSLFSPLEKQVGGAREKLRSAAEGFSSATTPFRSYGDIGAEGTLSKAIGPGAGTADVEAAKGLVGANYAGPQGLDQAALDEIGTALTEIKPRVGSLLSGAGAADLIRGQNAGLSQGQRQFEAKRLLKDQGYRGQAAGYEQELQNLMSDYGRSQQEARDISAQRTGEEADIAQKSRDYLGGQQGAISEALTPRVAEEEAKTKALQGAYQAWQENPTEENLARLNELGAGVNAGNLFTETQRVDKEAEAVRGGIIGKPEYASIAEAPTMELGVDHHGRERLRVPEEWWKENTTGKSKSEKKALKELLTKRQLELEQAGFSPGSGAAKNQHDKLRQATAKQVGKFSAYDPLYFAPGASFEKADPRSYLNFQNAAQATPDSLATADERERYNAISSLLGNPDQLMDVGGYHGAAVGNEADRYKAEEDAALKTRSEDLAKAVKRETKDVQRARSTSRASSKAIGRIVKGIGTFGGSETGAPGADLLPQFEGERAKKKLKKLKEQKLSGSQAREQQVR